VQEKGTTLSEQPTFKKKHIIIMYSQPMKVMTSKAMRSWYVGSHDRVFHVHAAGLCSLIDTVTGTIFFLTVKETLASWERSWEKKKCDKRWWQKYACR
jgi:hypothetical protein